VPRPPRSSTPATRLVESANPAICLLAHADSMSSDRTRDLTCQVSIHWKGWHVTAPKDPADPTEMAAFNKTVIDEYRANDGKVDGVFEEGTMALLHHVGQRSGVERVNPLGYFTDGDRIFVVASFGGSDVNPAWYRNLLANPRTTVEIGSETIPVTAREVTGAERDERFAKISETIPMFADYQRKTTRVIPVIELVRH
jgi:deazaflavin-dependent oxidoreductase (nitroreductase family)